MPGGARISICVGSTETSTSISLSSSAPSRSILRNFCRAAVSVGCMSWKLTSRAGGSSASSTRSSAASAARSRTLRVSLLARLLDRRLGEIADDGIDVAADVADLGELGRLDLDERRVRRACARRRAISVLPTPVGPIIRMFLGVISCRSGSATCCRRQRLRRAIATARLAECCPTMCLSSSWTISCGVISEDMVGTWTRKNGRP